MMKIEYIMETMRKICKPYKAKEFQLKKALTKLGLSTTETNTLDTLNVFASELITTINSYSIFVISQLRRQYEWQCVNKNNNLSGGH